MKEKSFTRVLSLSAMRYGGSFAKQNTAQFPGLRKGVCFIMKNLYRRICLMLSVFLLFISFASCGLKDQPDTQEEDEDDGITRYIGNYLRDAEYDGVYVTEEYEEPQTIALNAEIKEFGGFYISGDKIWVLNYIFDNILIFDMSGKLIKKIDGLVIAPNDITSDENGNVYISECGNERIIKLDSEGNYLDEYPFTRLKKLNNELKERKETVWNASLSSITYYGGKIYATSGSFNYKNMSGIYVFDVATKKETHMLEGVYGNISAGSDGNFYILQHSHYEWDENTQEGIKSFDGELYIQRIANGVLEEKFVRFDHSHSPNAMLVYGNEIYIAAGLRLYKFTTDGEYCGIVYDKFPGNTTDKDGNPIVREGSGMINSLSVDSEGNIYAYNHGDKKVYKFMKKVK